MDSVRFGHSLLLSINSRCSSGSNDGKFLYLVDVSQRKAIHRLEHAYTAQSVSLSQLWVVVLNIFFNFHPYLGKIPILANIFQRG